MLVNSPGPTQPQTFTAQNLPVTDLDDRKSSALSRFLWMANCMTQASGPCLLANLLSYICQRSSSPMRADSLTEVFLNSDV